jgi:ferritin
MPIKSLLSASTMALFKSAIESELYASNLYKHIANQLQRLGYFGAQEYFLKESAEELTHYQKLVDFINDMGTVAPVPSVPAITDKIPNLLAALELAYETELSLMDDYKKFYETVEDEEKDCITATFLIEFLQIQRKSVGEYGDFIARFNLNPNDPFEMDEFLKDK